MNGFEIAEEAKRIHPNIKVIYTSGYAKDVAFPQELQDMGITLLKKPYRRAELLGRVRTMLDS